MKILLGLLLTSLGMPSNAEPLIEEYYRRVETIDTAIDSVGEAFLAEMLTRAQQRCAVEPDSAEAWLESGVIRSAYAKDGYAAAFLARLYMTVPGWPISFGSTRKAANLLKEVVGHRPAALAGNLYEGLRLLEERQWLNARERFAAASEGALDCVCPHWINALRAQADEGLTTVISKMGTDHQAGYD